MSTIAIVMMILFMCVIWGGLLFAIVRGTKNTETDASRYLDAHPDLDV